MVDWYNDFVPVKYRQMFIRPQPSLEGSCKLKFLCRSLRLSICSSDHLSLQKFSWNFSWNFLEVLLGFFSRSSYELWSTLIFDQHLKWMNLSVLLTSFYVPISVLWSFALRSHSFGERQYFCDVTKQSIKPNILCQEIEKMGCLSVVWPWLGTLLVMASQ